MKRPEYRSGNIEYSNVIPWIISTNKIPRVDQHHMASYVLCSCLFILELIEIVIVFGIMYMVSYGSMLIV